MPACAGRVTPSAEVLAGPSPECGGGTVVGPPPVEPCVCPPPPELGFMPPPGLPELPEPLPGLPPLVGGFEGGEGTSGVPKGGVPLVVISTVVAKVDMELLVVCALLAVW